MTIEEISADRYRELFATPAIAFDSVGFNTLNAAKVASLRHLVMCDGAKVRLGLTVGVKADGTLRAPFSAPFAAIEGSGAQRLDFYVEGAAALAGYLRGRGERLVITLPPACYSAPYDRDAIAKQLPALLSTGAATVAHIDYNYHYDLADYSRSQALMSPASRRNLKTAVRHGLSFHAGTSMGDAYEIVVENHSDRGYPVHMSLDDLDATSRLIDIDCFEVRDCEGRAVAAAIIYHTSADAVQLIYWGDRPSARPMRPMNMLADGLLAHYAALGKRVFDFGPASSDGEPALGLCDFKSGLGCRLTCKPTVIVG